MGTEETSGADALAGVRRLRRVSGAVLAAFVVVHVAVQASALAGAAAYARVAVALSRSPLVGALEVLFVLVPLLVHVGTGAYLFRRATPAEVARYGGDRRLWALQQASAVTVLVFVLAHAWELRLARLFGGLSPDALYTTLTAHLSSTYAGVPWRALFYVVAVLATAVHLGTGLLAISATWKTPRARARAGAAVLAAVVFFLGAATVISVATGTRLLPAADDVSAPLAPCGSAVTTPAPPFEAPASTGPTPSR